jgi:hypothetical protein
MALTIVLFGTPPRAGCSRTTGRKFCSHPNLLRARLQQAFLEAHEFAFQFFGGVFGRLRYDNLKSAVKKILRGHQREETLIYFIL